MEKETEAKKAEGETGEEILGTMFEEILTEILEARGVGHLPEKIGNQLT